MRMGIKAQAHAMVISYPSQGHVIPLLELSHCLVDRGFKVTFVTTHISLAKITASSSQLLAQRGERQISHTDDDRIKMVPISDGMDMEADMRGQHDKLLDSIMAHMPGCLEELVSEMDKSEGEKISCIVADGTMGWAVDVALKLGIPAVAMWTAAAASHALFDVVPMLMASNILDAQGGVADHGTVAEIVPGLKLNASDLFWQRMPQHQRQAIFNYVFNSSKSANKAHYVLCNSFLYIEQAVFDHHPHLLPIGPLLPATRPGRLVGHFWPEDTSCLHWLDRQAPCSVVYVAFGSYTSLNKRQFQELALGLELSGRPFLWVVRPDLMMDGSTGDYPDGFLARTVAERGKMVSWAPQQKVLAHPSIACFVSHCGWNSVMEGVVNGVPFVCWPYFVDQFFNMMYVCDVWRVGVGLEQGGEDDRGVTKEEVKKKLEIVLGDEKIRASAVEIKEAAREWSVVGASKNFDAFIEKLLT